MNLGETVEAEAKRANRPGSVSRIPRVTKPLSIDTEGVNTDIGQVIFAATRPPYWCL